jgi:predicted O-linked N-acetylglucosamine transferase (SPINDLY family)
MAEASQRSRAVIHNRQGLSLVRQRQFEQAAAAFENAIREDPDYVEAYHNLGCAMCDLGKFSEAVSYYRQCLQHGPGDARTFCHLGIALTKSNQALDAECCFREALRIKPDYSGAHSAWGFALEAMDKRDEALIHYRRAVKLDPNNAEAHYNIGHALYCQGKCRDAAAAFQEALRSNPHFPAAHNSLGVTLAKLGDIAQGLAHCERAIELSPGYVAAYCNLGCALQLQGRLQEARQLYLEALRLEPACAEVHHSLGSTLWDLGDLAGAQSHFQRALEIQPRNATTLSSLATVLQDQGQLAEAHGKYVEALRLSPANVSIRSNYLASLNYLPEVDPRFIFDEHCLWGPPPGAPTPVAALPSRRRTAAEPLRIGYVSPNFYGHIVTSFFEPILRHHDPQNVGVVGYAELPEGDETTARLRSMCADWRLTCGLADEQVAELVRADGIDILVDLGGHLAGNRLGVFARKPAPVQVTYLGYCNTTGLTTIDYRLTDAVADPPGEPVRHSESLLRLPNVFCCFQPPEMAPVPSPLPALAKGWITLGSLHKPAKLNGTVLDLWVKILRTIPSTRLLICHHTIVNEVQERILREFRARDADVNQIIFRRIPKPGSAMPTQHLPVYNEIDISLDPFPWCGHATACQSLWMGVPVISLHGRAHAGRMVASVLKSVGLDDWIAATPDEYLELAVRWAANLERLAELRSGLRGMMEASPLCDGQSFTRNLEEAYRTMWRQSVARSI